MKDLQKQPEENLLTFLKNNDFTNRPVVFHLKLLNMIFPGLLPVVLIQI